MIRAACITIITLLLAPLAARAQTDEEQARARALFEMGEEHYRAERFAEAARAFEQSYEIYGHPGTLVNLAGALEDAGQRVEALERWNELLERFGAVISDEARERARSRVEALERSLASVSITSAPPGATLLCDGRELGRAPLDAPLVVEPGDHVIEARLEGHQDLRREVFLRAGANSPLTLTLQPIEREPERPARATLIVESATEGATITVDAGAPEPLPLERELEPGAHQLRIAAAGYEPQSRRVELPEGGEVRLAVTLVPRETGEDGQETDEEGRGFWRGPWPWIIGGVVLVGAGLGLGLGLGLQEEDPHVTWRLR